MKFNAIKKISVMLAIFLAGTYSGITIIGQEVSKVELEDKAFQCFDSHQYFKAASNFEILHNMFPKDSRFSYYLGRSYFHSNQKLDEAIELLKYSATRNYGDDTYYYLGRAYHLDYRFEDAALSFLTFKKTARNNDIKKYDIDYWIKVNESAKESVQVAQLVAVEKEKSVPGNALESAFDDELAGSYIYIPDAFRSTEDIALKYQSLMFLPNNLQIGDYIYFASNSKKDKQGLDIFRVEKVTAENFSLPEPLPAIINSEYDEAYPYFDKLSSTLYFSSKGHNTSGGYDIFKCSYDTSKASWTSVDRLNFPLNTPNDEFLYTLVSDSEKSIFLSNRARGLNEYIAYTITNKEQASYHSPKNRDEVLAFAALSSQDELDNMNITYQKYEQGTLTQNELSKYNNVFNEKAEYEHLLTKALILQSQSDSLAWIVKDLRAKIEIEDNSEKKQILSANIESLDMESKRLQMLADEKFLLAEQETDPIEIEIKQDDNPNLKVENDVNGIKVYSFSSEQKKKDVYAESNDKSEYEKGKGAAKLAQSMFAIQPRSPYSQSNPIPSVSIPLGLIYKIQLGSFSQAVPENTFNGLTPVSKEEENGSTKYYVGSFASLKEVRRALEQVRNYGYPDAFIVSFNNNKKINIQKAKEIEFASK